MITPTPCHQPPGPAGRPDAAPPPARAAAAAPAITLRSVFRDCRGRVLLTYGLFSLENLLRLAQPWALGLAIDGLLRRSSAALLPFVAQHVGFLLIRAARQAYDTRTFTRVYGTLAARMIGDQRGRAVDVSRVAARSALSREFVEFFEHGLPHALYCAYSLAGSLVMLGSGDGALLLYCLGLGASAATLNWHLGRKALGLNRSLNDAQEAEVDVIARNRPAEVSAHFARLARLRVRISDFEALTFGAIDLFVLGMLAAGLVRSCALPDASAGEIYALFRYLLMFAYGLESVPLLVQQGCRLHDIGARLRDGGGAAPDAG